MFLKAKICCDKDKKFPLSNHYRPGFDFGIESLIGGEIFLLDKDKILQGEDGMAHIKLIKPDLIEGKLEYDKKYFFYEGPRTTKAMGFCILLKE